MASLATCVRSALSPSISPFYASQLAHFVIGCHSSVQQLLRRPSSNCIFCHYELVSGSPPWHTPSTEFAESWPNVSGSSLLLLLEPFSPSECCRRQKLRQLNLIVLIFKFFSLALRSLSVSLAFPFFLSLLPSLSLSLFPSKYANYNGRTRLNSKTKCVQLTAKNSRIRTIKLHDWHIPCDSTFAWH